jgi:hypothetical protein
MKFVKSKVLLCLYWLSGGIEIFFIGMFVFPVLYDFFPRYDARAVQTQTDSRTLYDHDNLPVTLHISAVPVGNGIVL